MNKNVKIGYSYLLDRLVYVNKNAIEIYKITYLLNSVF